MWTRNTCKYGDNFVYLKLDSEKGIMGCQQLPNIEIERLERGMKIKPSHNTTEDAKSLKFVWKVKDMEMNTWEVCYVGKSKTYLETVVIIRRCNVGV